MLHELAHASAQWTPSDMDSVIGAALAGMRAHAAVAAVQDSGILLLCRLQQRSSDEIARKTCDQGAIEVAVAALHAHPVTSVQLSCSMLLLHIVVDPTLATRAGDAHAVEAVVGALRCQLSQLSSERAVFFACLALQRMVSDNQRNQLAAAGAGILDALTAALRMHGTTESVHVSCCSLLAHVTENCGSNFTLPSRVNACDAVLGTLHVHGADSQVAHDGLCFLRNVLPLDADDAAVERRQSIHAWWRLRHACSPRTQQNLMWPTPDACC